MEKSALIKLKAQCPDTVFLEHEPMSSHCSFRIGGECTMAVPQNTAALQTLVRACFEQKAEYFVLGKGTNILPPDEGMERLVICTLDALSDVHAEGDILEAGAGCTLARAALCARDACLTGMEFAHGIPGSIGGAIYMNAGAYGGEIRDTLRSVTVLEPDGSFTELSAKDLSLGYRTSVFEKGRKGIVVSARFALSPGDREAIAARMKELMEKRTASQPLDMPSAGSAFKRPATGYAAAMIDSAGLRGFACGGAMVSTKHAGFIVNAGNATAADVMALVKAVQEKVQEKYDVLLEPEVRLLKP